MTAGASDDDWGGNDDNVRNDDAPIRMAKRIRAQAAAPLSQKGGWRDFPPRPGNAQRRNNVGYIRITSPPPPTRSSCDQLRTNGLAAPSRLAGGGRGGLRGFRGGGFPLSRE